MQKPNNYDNTPAGGNYEAPEVGGHHMIIKQVNESQTKAGKPMVVILVDFAKNDKQPELFMKQFKDDIRPDRKWPRGGTIYCTTTDKDGKTSRNFKTFCTCYEKSNGATINGRTTARSGAVSSKTRRSAAFTAWYIASTRARKRSARSSGGSLRTTK